VHFGFGENVGQPRSLTGHLQWKTTLRGQDELYEEYKDRRHRGSTPLSGHLLRLIMSQEGCHGTEAEVFSGVQAVSGGDARVSRRGRQPDC
jgi:hypothetical protein